MNGRFIVHKGIKKKNGVLLKSIGMLCYNDSNPNPFSVNARSLRNDYVTCPLCKDIMENKFYPSNSNEIKSGYRRSALMTASSMSNYVKRVNKISIDELNEELDEIFKIQGFSDG